MAIAAGCGARSVVLIGFGVDSLIETASAGIVGHRLWEEFIGKVDKNVEGLEKRAAKVSGALLLLLAVYITIDSILQLTGVIQKAEGSVLGIAVAGIALMLMPALAQAKLKIAERIGSKALKVDAMESVCCAWLSLATLLGLILNATLSWWWADPVAGLVIVPLLVREALEGLTSKECCCSCSKVADTPANL